MALVISGRSDLFPVGTSVQAFAGNANRHHGGRPSGSSVATATVAADGSLTFAGVAAGLYTLWASVSSKDVNLLAGAGGFSPLPNLRARLAAAGGVVGAPALS